jgi:hypothetical protein
MMGLPGHVKIKITTTCERNVFTRKLEILGWTGLCGLSVSACYYDLEVTKKESKRDTEYSLNRLKSILSDTLDLPDGFYKIANIQMEDCTYKFRPIEEVPEEDRDLYE